MGLIKLGVNWKIWQTNPDSLYSTLQTFWSKQLTPLFIPLQIFQLNFIWVGLGKLQGKGVTQFSVSYGGGFSWRIV